MTDELKTFINDNIELINQNTKESWEKIYRKLHWKITGEFTQTILDAGINDPAKIIGYLPGSYLYGSKIKNYRVPDSVIRITNYSLAYCSNLTSVVIPDSVTSIGDSAFEGCNSLTNIEIPAGVTNIGQEAFRDCKSLTRIEYNGTKEQWENIFKDAEWNVGSIATKIICTDGVIEL